MNRLLVVALIAALAIPAGAGAKLIVGISDQNASTFSDPLYAKAKLTVARYVVPYDVTSDPAQNAKFAGWLSAARAAKQKVLVSFEHSRRSRTLARPDLEHLTRAAKRLPDGVPPVDDVPRHERGTSS